MKSNEQRITTVEEEQTSYAKMQNKFGEVYFHKVSGDVYASIFKEQQNLILENLIPVKEDKILDIGCGKGITGKLLEDKIGCDVTFSDVTLTAQEYLKNKNFVLCSMSDTPFKNGQFDKIYATSVISHIEDIDKALREMKRILKNGGSILITTNNKWTVQIHKLASFIKLIPKHKYDPTAIKMYSSFTFRKLLEKNGWKS